MKAPHPRIVLLSGPVGAGKSALARQLVERHDATIIKTRELIKAIRPNVTETRVAFQRAGEALDKADNGAWLAEALAKIVEENLRGGPPPSVIVVDSVRIVGQIDAVRSAFGSAVHHIHLTASDSELERRFLHRSSQLAEPASYQDVRRSRTEKYIGKLAGIADVVVETDRCTPGAVCVRATALLGLYPRSVTPLVDVLVGGQYGSEGKGNIVGHIAPEYQLLVRVGGPNAGHKVFNDPVEVYHHIPSGTNRAPNARLVLGAGAVINVEKILQEIATHRIGAERLAIDPHAMIIEKADIETEERLLSGISSTKQGVGAATARKALNRIPEDQPVPEGVQRVRLADEVTELRPFISEAQGILEAAYLRGDRILLEGTQGTALSLHHGPYPYVTSRDTTVAGCLADAGIAATRVRRVILVCRTFPIRVGGTSGYIEHEISYEELSSRSGIPIDELRKTETTTTTRKQRRLGDFDWEQLRRSTLLNGPTDLALTFVDYLDIKNRDAYRFEQLTRDTVRFIEEVERVSGVPVSLISTSFGWRNVIDRRAW